MSLLDAVERRLTSNSRILAEIHRAKLEARATERERCAKIAEELHVFKDEYSVCATIAARIRSAQ